MSGTSRKLILLTAILILADQVTKFLSRRNLDPHESIELLPFLNLVRVQNRGISFGMLEGHSAIILTVSVLIVAILVITAIVVRDNERMVIPLSFLVAGSAGNLLDRIFRGSVTDFLRLPHWPAFNLADIFIFIGVGLLIYYFIFPEGIRHGNQATAL